MRHRTSPSGRHRPATRTGPRHRSSGHARGSRQDAGPRGRTAGTRLLAASVLATGLLAVGPVSANAPGDAPGGALAAALAPTRGMPATPARPATPPELQVDRAPTAAAGASLCARPPAAVGRDDVALSRLAPTVVALACDPFAAVAGLEPTELEAREPERLYALVTREQPVEPVEYAPDDLVPLLGGPYQAREEVRDQLVLLLEAAADAGHPAVYVNSGFRDYWTQAGTYQDWVERSGADRAGRVSALPGHSEHQLGLAVDLTGTCGGFACFGDSPEGQWVAQNAHRFGFLIRYPEGGDEVTGYAYEPWHLRYVGPRAAWAMHLRGEAYWENFAPVALEAATVD